MPWKEKEIEKLYYPIGEVGQMLGVSPSLIRFWEQEFDILRPKKNRKGNRQFTEKDIENLKLIYHLVKERGYTLDGARKKLKGNPDGMLDKVALIESLKKIRKFLVQLKSQL